MESIQSFIKILSFFVWFGLLAVCCLYWCKGLVDGKSMFKLFGILLSIGFGYEVVQIVISNSSSSVSENIFSCKPGEGGVYLNCAGWPIFSTSISFIAEKVVASNNYLYAFASGYIQIITAIVIFSKFSRSVWTADMKEIFFAFSGGAILYVSLAYMGEIEEAFMQMTQYLLGFSNHHGSEPNSISEVISNLKNWNDIIDGLIAVSKDQDKFSFGFVTSSLSLLLMYLLWGIMKIPLVWFSLLNVIMLFMQQLLLLSLPVDAIKMSMSVNVDPFMIVRKLFAISMLSMAVVMEFHILNWLPNPPELGLAAAGGIAIGTYIGLLGSAFIVLGVLVVGALVSTIVIFKAFYAGKEAMESMK